MPKRDRSIRNHVAQSPLLRKGGVHTKSKTGKRVRARLLITSAIDEWLDELEDNNDNQRGENGERGLPFLWIKSYTSPCPTDLFRLNQ
jgi:hypothetical protein